MNNSNNQLSLFANPLHHTTKNGIDLYFDPESDLTGTSISGLARMLGCDKKLIQRKAVALNLVESREAHTGQGVQGVSLILEHKIPLILESIIGGSRTSKKNKASANKVQSRLAQAGFRLMVLLEVAPDVVAKIGIDNITDPKKAKRVSEYAEQHAKYLNSYHGLTETLKSCGATLPNQYAAVNKYNNELIGIEKGKRQEMTEDEKDMAILLQTTEKMKLRKSNITDGWKAVNVAKQTGKMTHESVQKVLA